MSGLRYRRAMDQHTPVEPKELSRRLRMIMGDKRMTRKKLSELTGITRTSLASKLDADVQFTYEELVLVIEALGVAWEELTLADPFPGGPAASLPPPPRIKDLRSKRDRPL